MLKAKRVTKTTVSVLPVSVKGEVFGTSKYADEKMKRVYKENLLFNDRNMLGISKIH